MQKIIAILFIFSVLLVSCASPASAPTATPMPSPTFTAAPTSTKIPEPTPTAPAGDEPGGDTDPTPPAPELNMTWGDWKEMFDFTYTYAPTGVKFDVLSEVLRKTKVLDDQAEIAALKNNPNLVILFTNGNAQCMATPQEASVAAGVGATVLQFTTDGATSPGNICNWVLRAQNNSYLAGNRGVRMSFGETPRAPFPPGDFWIDKTDILVIKDGDGRMTAAVLEKPLHYAIGTQSLSLFDVDSPTDDTEHWVEEVMSPEHTGIYVYTE